jgi:Adenylyl/Guanylyl and SMODS C-terminal sensor domain
MFDLSKDLQTFYDNHVRLGGERREQLAGHRDLNLQRINGGLDDLAEETGRARPHPYDYKNQGGYAMHTLNQAEENDYDIDVALLFNKEDLPIDPLAARQRVRDALVKRRGNFSKDPEARTNAVTVWYEDGYHVDFAIYRTWKDAWGTSYTEHASTEWVRRDPMEVNDWFTRRVAEKSPKAGFLSEHRVASGQMRRIVRFLKRFCRSRASWSLPGGMVVSALVDEVYRPDSGRDDIALYNTVVALRDRLRGSTVVRNPVNNSQELTSSEEVLNQVQRLRDKLDMAVSKLAVLFQPGCTREQARSSWDWIFNHEYWGKVEDTVEEASRAAIIAAMPCSVTVRCDLAKSHEGVPYKRYANGSTQLPKSLWLKFSVASTNAQVPYEVRWTVNNKGDEASRANDLSWNRTGTVCWTSTKYKGIQTMTCEIEKASRVVARATFYVKIKGGGWRAG